MNFCKSFFYLAQNIIRNNRRFGTRKSEMSENETTKVRKRKKISEHLKDSGLLILAVVFIALYAAAFAGKLDPLRGNTILLRLEPVIFILIGYYFGRFPSRSCERTLKEEIDRQTQRADAAQYAKEKAQQEREILEEKIKNVRMAIKTITPSEQNPDDRSKTKAIEMALSILDS